MQEFKVSVVWLILNGKTEQALDMLAQNYNVDVPKLKVGLPKGRKTRTLGCYTPKNKTISVTNSDKLADPFVVLHEFYHHLRTNIDQQHKGNERLANQFATDYIQAYNTKMMNKTDSRDF